MNDLFQDINSINLIYYSKILTERNDIEKLRCIFNSITLSQTSESLYGIMGSLLLTFTYNDNSVRNICFTAKLLSEGNKTYKINRDICAEVRALFE